MEKWWGFPKDREVGELQELLLEPYWDALGSGGKVKTLEMNLLETEGGSF